MPKLSMGTKRGSSPKKLTRIYMQGRKIIKWNECLADDVKVEVIKGLCK